MKVADTLGNMERDMPEASTGGIHFINQHLPLTPPVNLPQPKRVAIVT